MARKTAGFLLIQWALYLTFLALDLRNTAPSWSTGLKYGSILVCLLAAFARSQGEDGRLVCAALSFTALADLFLLVVGRNYLIGLALFCVVQALYLVRILRTRHSHVSLSLLLRGALLLSALAVMSALHARTPLTTAAVLYFTQLAANAAESLTMRPQNLRFSLGLTLFLCCDLCVGIQNLPAALPTALAGFTRIGMWLFYLPSQVLITLSIRKK